MNPRVARAMRAATSERIPRYVAGVERRQPYETEVFYFAANPHVAGMAAEDDRVVLNPFSPNSNEAQRAVAYNEAARVHMRTNPALRPKFNLTDEQSERFGTYGAPDDQRQTVAARLLSGDASAGTPSPAQVAFANKLRDEIGYADGGDVQDNRSMFSRAADTALDYAGRGLALGDLYTGGVLSSLAGLNPFGSYSDVMAAREKALAGVPREAKALATEPINPVAAIFAGPMARTANKMMLRRAEELAAQNTPREQIWRETGWFQGPDKKWRFEIDDSADYQSGQGAIFQPGNVRQQLIDQGIDPNVIDEKGFGTKLGKVYSHPELYAAYPELAEVGWASVPGRSIDNHGGMWYGMNQGMSVDNKVARSLKHGRSVTAHEAQHGVQDLEGFSRGANPKQFKKVDEDRSMLTDANVLAVIMSGGKTLDQARAEFTNIMRRSPTLGAESVAISGETPKDILSRRAALLDPLEAYRRTAGEVEARAVQKRLDMPPHYRKFRAPWLDYDVPEADQIVRLR